jgi:ribosomal protein S18 acetylase RimI-like enzyme
LIVLPEHRRRGHAKAALRHVAELARSQGHRRLELHVFSHNAAAQALYRAAGYDVTSLNMAMPLAAPSDDATDRAFASRSRLPARRSEHRSGAMPAAVVLCTNDVECEALGAFLVERIYEFNSTATGYFDGRLLGGCIRSDAGEIIAGFNGHTWGRCCELSHVWVHERHRGRGLGTRLLRCAESEARARGCVQLVLATHDFQAPGLYERLGYRRQYAIEGRPVGHANIIFAKAIEAGDRG